MIPLSFNAIAAVAVGGAVGAVMRYVVSVWALRLFGSGFPIGTLLANVVGSFVMGILVVLIVERGLPEISRLLLMTGLLGGFTTFSAFSLETLTLWQKGHPGTALLYAGMSVGLTVLVVWVGYRLAKGWI